MPIPHKSALPFCCPPQKKYNYKEPEHKDYKPEPKYDEPKYGEKEPHYKTHGEYNAPEYKQGPKPYYPQVGFQQLPSA